MSLKNLTTSLLITLLLICGRPAQAGAQNHDGKEEKQSILRMGSQTLTLPPKGKPVPMEDIKRICLACDLEDLWQKIKADPPEKPFVSDGASAFPDQIGKIDLYPAAFLHDLKYWAGYPKEYEERMIADCQLAIDVIRLCGGKAELADLILRGVRLGGTSRLKTPWRWGFGRK